MSEIRRELLILGSSCEPFSITQPIWACLSGVKCFVACDALAQWNTPAGLKSLCVCILAIVYMRAFWGYFGPELWPYISSANCGGFLVVWFWVVVLFILPFGQILITNCYRFILLFYCLKISVLVFARVAFRFSEWDFLSNYHHVIWNFWSDLQRLP